MMKISRNRVTGCSVHCVHRSFCWGFLLGVFGEFLSTIRLGVFGVFGVFGSWEFLGFLVYTWLLNKIYFL